MSVDTEQDAVGADEAPAVETRFEEGRRVAVSVGADLLSVADDAGGMVIGGVAGLISGIIQGLRQGFDRGQEKGGLIGGILGIPIAAISEGMIGLASGMSSGLERGVTDLIGPTKSVEQI
jgi:hypothetical protein